MHGYMYMSMYVTLTHCGEQIEPSGSRPLRPLCAATQTFSSLSPHPVPFLGSVGVTALPQQPLPVAQSQVDLVPFGCQQPSSVCPPVQLQPQLVK